MSIFLFFFGCSARTITPSVSCTLINTTYRTQESYHSLLKLCSATGISPTFCHPSKRIPEHICDTDVVFLALDNQFLDNQESLYAQLVINPLKDLLKKTKPLAYFCQEIAIIKKPFASLKISASIHQK